MSKMVLWEKQVQAIERVKKRKSKGVGLLMEMGTGKTAVTIKWLEWLFARGARIGYIVAPLTAMHVWVEEWYKWGHGPIAFVDLHESGSAGIRMAHKLAKEGGYPVICLVNYEMAWQIGYQYITHKRKGKEVKIFEVVDTTLHDKQWDFGILDESSAIKTPGSKCSKFFRTKMREKTTYRSILNGSAYKKRPSDVWAQIKFITGEEIFPGSFAAFQARYAIPNPYIRGAVIGYHNLDDFVKRISKCCILIKKEEMVDLPPFVHETRYLELSPKSRKFYDALTADMIADLEEFEEGGGVVTATHVFSIMRKQLQICAGFVFPDMEIDPDDPDAIIVRSPAVRLGTEKLDELVYILDQRDSPTIIVTQHDEEERMIVEAVRKQFNFIPKVLNGSVKGAERRHELIKSASSDLCFVVKESVGAKGIDLRFADMTIFYAHSPHTENYYQILSRNHRGGQTKNITYTHLQVRDSADIRVMRILARDFNVAEQIEKDWRKILK